MIDIVKLKVPLQVPLKVEVMVEVMVRTWSGYGQVQSAISINFFSSNGIKCTSYISWIDGNDKKKNLERIFN